MAKLDELIKASAPKTTSAKKQGGSSPAPSLDNLLSASPKAVSPTSRALIVPKPEVKSGLAYGLRQTGKDFLELPGRVGGVFSTFAGGAVDAYKEVAGQAPTKSFNLYDALDTGSKTLTDTINDSADRLTKAFEVQGDPNSTITQRAGAVGEAGLGIVSGIFSIVNVPLQSMTRIPVIGHVADKVNELFGALGGGGAAVADKTLDELPISDQHKEDLRPLVNEIGALSAQIIAGKAGHDLVPVLTKKTIELTRKVGTAIKDASTKPIPAPAGGVDALLQNSPRKLDVQHLPSEYTDRFYTPESRLPTIEMGPKAPSSGLPTIDIGTGRTTKGSPSRVEPIVEPPGGTPLLTVSRPTARTRVVAPVGTGEVKLSTLATKVDARAVEEGLTKALGDLPEYKTMNIAEQARLATDLLSRDPRMALQIARGERLPPPNLHPEAVFKAVEDAALRAGDIRTIQEIATGNLSTQATAMGQRIRLLGERDQTSPVAIIREVTQARQANIETKTGVKYEKAKANVVEEIKTEVKKAAPDKQTWESFIKSLECGY